MFPPPVPHGAGGSAIPPPHQPPAAAATQSHLQQLPQVYNNNNALYQQQQQHVPPPVAPPPAAAAAPPNPMHHHHHHQQQQVYRNAQQQQPYNYQSQQYPTTAAVPVGGAPSVGAAPTVAAGHPPPLQHHQYQPQQQPPPFQQQQQHQYQQPYPHQQPYHPQHHHHQQQQQYVQNNNGGGGAPPGQPGSGGAGYVNGGLSGDFGRMSVTSEGFNKLWGTEYVDLLKQRQVVSAAAIAPPEIRHQNEMWRDRGASHELFRCTLTKIPETKSLLQKSRLPLGILIHPFKDLTQLPVIQCSTIVRCRSCRTYINPFVYFVDSRRWKCNLCFRVNDLPEEFQYDPLTKTYGDPSRRPEVNSGTIEFLAPADYMVRPPQAAVYLFVLETSVCSVETGYLKVVCDSLLENLDSLPGDSRTQVGFITFDGGRVSFYDLSGSAPAQLSVCDVEDCFVPLPPEGLLVPLRDCGECVKTLLRGLPAMFMNQNSSGGQRAGSGSSALGSAVGVACKLMGAVGGRISVFCATLPSSSGGQNRVGVGSNGVRDLNPGTDYFKKLALECSSNYIAVDVFFVGDAYVDIASVGCIAKFSGGCLFRVTGLGGGGDSSRTMYLENLMQRYLTRKIGFEAVMRVRCTRGLSIHTFHGNLFVRSTDLLSLPNCNPDAGFGMQVSIDEDLRDFQTVCFQAALLYTSSKGERRIRVHTLCLPVGSTLGDVINGADQQCIVGLLAKMGVDRALSSGVGDAREAFLNAAVDILGAYATTQNNVAGIGSGLIAPPVLQVLPTYIHALLRSVGFRADLKPSVDDRVHFYNTMKAAPLRELIQTVYPDLYPVHNIQEAPLIKTGGGGGQQPVVGGVNGVSDEDEEEEEEEEEVPVVGLLNLCSDRIDAVGVYVLDKPECILVYVCRNVSPAFVEGAFGVQGGFNALPHEMSELPEVETTSSSVLSRRLRSFIGWLQGQKPFPVPLRVIREDSRSRLEFVGSLVEDRGDSSGESPSYYEFLQRVKSLVK